MKENGTTSGTDEPSFRKRVLNLVARIPPGRVMTYGQLADLADRPGEARQVGYVLNGLSSTDAGEAGLPWQRVINAQGRLSTYKVGTGDLQRALLEAEGVTFDATGRCDLSRLRWWPEEGEGGPARSVLG